MRLAKHAVAKPHLLRRPAIFILPFVQDHPAAIEVLSGVPI
jgi:hypothetical protein